MIEGGGNQKENPAYGADTLRLWVSGEVTLYFILPYSVLSYRILFYSILYYPILFIAILSYLILSYPTPLHHSIFSFYSIKLFIFFLLFLFFLFFLHHFICNSQHFLLFSDVNSVQYIFRSFHFCVHLFPVFPIRVIFLHYLLPYFL